jgi:ParB family chromosome partitioning protein
MKLRAADSDIGQNVDASSNGGQQAGASAQRTVISVAVAPTEAEEDHEDAAKPLPGRLITELTAHPTLALRDALAENAVNALYEPANRYNQGHVSTHNVRTRLDQADVLACAVGLDMVQAGWKSKVDNDLGRVTKPRILEAVREAKGESSAQLIDHLKKGDTAKEAERLLNGSGWLPEPLRLADVASVPADQEGEAGPLPDFLSEDEGRDIAANDQPECEAAE